MPQDVFPPDLVGMAKCFGNCRSEDALLPFAQRARGLPWKQRVWQPTRFGDLVQSVTAEELLLVILSLLVCAKANKDSLWFECRKLELHAKSPRRRGHSCSATGPVLCAAVCARLWI